MPNETYAAFLAHVRDLHNARAIERLLDWDQETHMPRRGAADRAEHLALIAGVAHQKLTDDRLGELLDKLESAGQSDDPALSTNVREVRREFDRARKLPVALVQDLARATALAKEVWADARRNSNFAPFAPHLERILELKREVAKRVGYSGEPYDALLDEFEPGATAAEVHAVFEQLKPLLVRLAAEIQNESRKPDISILQRDCPIEGQAAFNRTLVEALGFDFDAGRIDTTVHPFCSGISPRDVRLTNRYDARYMPMSLFGILHETGHGLYEQGFDPAHVATPMAEAVSLGIHESQSRMWENQVGRSLGFWRFFYPKLQAAMPAYRDVALDAWHFAINNVRPSFIRVEADEVTYGLHIMLRFDLERRMIRGELAVRDVPAAWNEGFKTLLGITPPNDAQGCLQDIHWCSGLIGYFPTYALGNLYAAQFFAAAKREIPDLDARIERGELLPLRDWLREKIHRHGRRFRAGELVKHVAGEALSPRAFIDYLNAKFRPLYGI